MVCPVKMYVKAQTFFLVIEMMSCSSKLLEINKNMYKSGKLSTSNVPESTASLPHGMYSQLKVAQFVAKRTGSAVQKQQFINTFRETMSSNKKVLQRSKAEQNSKRNLTLKKFLVQS